MKIPLPTPIFVGTPKDAPKDTTALPPSDKPRPLMMAPKDVTNLAPSAKISSSDTGKTDSMLAKITDGDKEASDSSVLMLRKGTQYVQFDLGAPKEIYAVVIWHAFDSLKIYRDVIVEVSDDPGFAKDVHVIFNNDQDNSSGRGVGTDREYYETYEGKLIEAKGVKGRYVRCYSKGSTDTALNEYTEVEIYGRAPK